MARKAVSALAGRKAVVRVERNGACIEVHNVDAAEAGMVLADILSTFRALTRKYDELIPDLQPVPGGSPVDGDASDFGARRVGFTR